MEHSGWLVLLLAMIGHTRLSYEVIPFPYQTKILMNNIHSQDKTCHFVEIKTVMFNLCTTVLWRKLFQAEGVVLNWLLLLIAIMIMFWLSLQKCEKLAISHIHSRHDRIVTLRSVCNAMRTYNVLTIPSAIVKAMKLKDGESLRIYTDGEKLYIDRFEEPTI